MIYDLIRNMIFDIWYTIHDSNDYVVNDQIVSISYQSNTSQITIIITYHWSLIDLSITICYLSDLWSLTISLTHLVAKNNVSSQSISLWVVISYQFIICIRESLAQKKIVWNSINVCPKAVGQIKSTEHCAQYQRTSLSRNDGRFPCDRKSLWNADKMIDSKSSAKR